MDGDRRFALTAEYGSVIPVNPCSVHVDFRAKDEEVLKHFDIYTIIAHFGIEDILNTIGEEHIESFLYGE